MALISYSVYSKDADENVTPFKILVTDTNKTKEFRTKPYSSIWNKFLNTCR